MRFLAALLAVISLNCAAAPFTVRLGIERVVLDTPPGFSDTTELASPRLQDLANTLTAASNRILIFALSDADVRNFTLGDQLEVKRYMIAVTPKELERERVTQAQFSRLVSDSLHDLGKPVVSTDLIKFLETQPIGKLHLISEQKKEDLAISVMQATRLPPLPGKKFYEGSTPQYLFFTTTIFLLRGKALQLAVYSVVDGPADLDWLKTITQRWYDELQRLNQR
jgi:putative ubiquitin-RnfH superfamily antitoxin RatB of RatAB toxin-antitoxin module